MSPKEKNMPDFFEENPFDPVRAATGSLKSPSKAKGPAVAKQKAGFYLTKDLLDRFNRKFYELKLEGVAIENKSALVELALKFTLDDIDRGSKSEIRKLL